MVVTRPGPPGPIADGDEQRVAGGERQRFRVGESPGANLGTAQILKDGNHPAGIARRAPDTAGDRFMGGVAAMREIQAEDVHAGVRSAHE